MRVLSMDVDAPLTSEDLQRLDNLMDVQGGMRLPRLHGFLTAVITSPLVPKTEQWYPFIWRETTYIDEPPPFIDETNHLIMRLYHDVFDQMVEDCLIPIISATEESYEQACQNTEAVQRWCYGYIEGMAVNIDPWCELDAEQGALFYFPLMILAHDDKTVLENIPAMFEEASLEEMREISTIALPVIISQIYNYWWEQEENDVAFDKYIMAKIGRNDLCPCGSGKKYKKCCLQKMMN